eukprot:SAG11_NODE_653_length_7913_cov_86.345790_9_plen_123_part_00
MYYNIMNHLPDEIYQMIYRHVMDRAIGDTIKLACWRNLPVRGKKTNSRVIYSWVNGDPFKANSMRTDGKTLYSYNLIIGHTYPGDVKVLMDYTAKGLGFYSQTTSVQVNLARPYADRVLFTR